MTGIFCVMGQDHSRIVNQAPKPGILERALAKIAAELHYTRPAGRLWPDLLLLPLAIVFFVGYLLSISPVLRRVPGSAPGVAAPFVGAIGIIVGLTFLLSLGVFGIIQGVGLKRPSSIILGAIMLIIVASASVFLLLFMH